MKSKRSFKLYFWSVVSSVEQNRFGALEWVQECWAILHRKAAFQACFQWTFRQLLSHWKAFQSRFFLILQGLRETTTYIKSPYNNYNLIWNSFIVGTRYVFFIHKAEYFPYFPISATEWLFMLSLFIIKRNINKNSNETLSPPFTIANTTFCHAKLSATAKCRKKKRMS